MNCKERKKVIVYGCGAMGKRVFTPLYDNYNIQVVRYADSKKVMGNI